MKVYIDTSVVGGCFDDEFSEESRAFFGMARRGRISLLLSNILADELALAPERVQKVVTELPQDSFAIVTENDASRRLRLSISRPESSERAMATMRITWQLQRYPERL